MSINSKCLDTVKDFLNSDNLTILGGSCLQSIPRIRDVTSEMADRNFLCNHADNQKVVNAKYMRIMNDPELAHLIIKK